MLKVERLEQKLRAGQTLIGSHCQIGEAVVAQIMALQGFDILWIDTEHSAIDRRDLNHMLMAIGPTQTAALVRVPAIEQASVKAALDMGADGIIFPNVRTREEASMCVALTHYPPDGIRGYGPQMANLYGQIPSDEYVGHVAQKVWTVVQIEDWRAVEQLESILGVPGIDMVQIGPKDLSASMGKLLSGFDDELWGVFKTLVDKAHAAGLPVGASFGYGGDTGVIERWAALGVDWINLESDISFLVDGSRGALKAARDALNAHE